MTISVSEALLSGPYSGDGATTTFDYDFKIYAETELSVLRQNADGTVTTFVLTTDYTVSGVGDAGGGTITLTAGSKLPTGATMTIEPDVTMSQDRPFTTQSSTTLAQIELALDKVTSLIRQLLGKANRSLKVSAARLSNGFSTSLDGVSAGQYLRVNDDNSGISGVEAQLAVSEVQAWFQQRDAASALQGSLLAVNSVFVMDGLGYRANPAVTLANSATKDLGVAGVEPLPDVSGFVSEKHYGVVRDLVTSGGVAAFVSGTDNADAFARLLANNTKIRLSDGGAYCSGTWSVDGEHVIIGTGRSCVVHFPNTANRWVEVGANTQFTGVLQDFRIQCDDHSAATGNSGFAWISAAQCQAARIEAREFRYPHYFAPGDGQFVAYNEFHHISAVGGLRNIYRNASGTGWVNQNKFFGGRAFTRSHTEYNVHWDDGAGNGGSENAFLHMSLEGAGIAAAYIGGAGNLLMDCRTEGTWSSDDIVLSANSQRCLVINHSFYTTVTDNGAGNSYITNNDGSQFTTVLNGTTPLTLDYAGATDQTTLKMNSSRSTAAAKMWEAESNSLVRGYLDTLGTLFAGRALYIGQSGYAFEPLRMGDVWVWWDGDYLRTKENAAPTSATDGAILQPVQTSVAAGLGNDANIVNTVGKFEGKMVFDTGLNQPVWATGSGATATWVYADGTTAYTPT